MHFKRGTAKDQKPRTSWGTPKELQPGRTHNPNGKKGTLKKHGKICSKTGEKHDFQKVGEQIVKYWPPKDGGMLILDFKCKHCGKKDCQFIREPTTKPI